MTAPSTRTAIAARYQAVGVKTCTPVQLVSMLFDGAIRFASEASQAMEKGDRARAGNRIGKCHDIVSHLASTLDASHAPELSENLMGLYAFCMRRLIEANFHQDRAMVDEVVTVLTPLRDAWATLAGR